MFLQDGKGRDDFWLRFGKKVSAIVALLTVGGIPFIIAVNSGDIHPSDYANMLHVGYAIIIAALSALPHLTGGCYLAIGTLLLVFSVYLLFSQRSRPLIDTVVIAMSILVSIVGVSWAYQDSKSEDANALYNISLTVKASSNGQAVENVQVCVMRYAFSSNHKWLCRVTDSDGNAHFSAQSGMYDLSLADESLRKYPNTQSQRFDLKQGEKKTVDLDLR